MNLRAGFSSTAGRRIARQRPVEYDVNCPSCGGRGSISARHRLLKLLLQKASIYAFRCLRCERRFFKRHPLPKKDEKSL